MHPFPITSQPASNSRPPLHSPSSLSNSKARTASTPLFASGSVDLNSTDAVSIHAHSLTPDQIKAEKVNEKAREVFKHYKTPEALLGYLKNRNVQVIEAQKNPWAQKFLKQIGSGAVTLYPDSLQYDQINPDYELKIPGAPPEYEKLARDIEIQKRPTMLVSTAKAPLLMRLMLGNTAVMDMLRHETYHLLQYDEKLPFNSADPKIRHQVAQTRMNLLHRLGQVNSLNPFKFVKGIIAWKHLMDTVNNPLPNRESSDEVEKIRTAFAYSAQREQETHAFFLINGEDLGSDSKADNYNSIFLKFHGLLKQYSKHLN